MYNQRYNVFLYTCNLHPIIMDSIELLLRHNPKQALSVYKITFPHILILFKLSIMMPNAKGSEYCCNVETIFTIKRNVV